MYRLVKMSRNGKTGPMAAVYGSRESCSETCALYLTCYGKQGHTALHWAGAGDSSAAELLDFIRAIPRGSMWRFGVVGDLPHDAGIIDARALQDIARANRGRPVLAYTHHQPTAENLQALEAVRHDMHVNISCDSVHDIRAVLSAGLSAVTYTAAADTRKAWIGDGIRYVTCPNQSTRRAPTCATCQLCARPRDYVIVFRAHGNQKNKMQGVV